MVHMSEQQLRQLQLIELEILLEVDRICRKNKIRYNITGGTLLGAVRHQGFIPWDDDTDVALLRNEYERFKIVCKKDLDTSRFYFQDVTETEGYRWSYGKIRRKNTVYIRENQEHMPYEQGIFIDVFPIDNIHQNYIVRVLNNFHCFCIRKLFWSEVGRVEERSIIKRKLYGLMSHIPREKIVKHYINLVHKMNKKESTRVRVALMPLPMKSGLGHLREWYEESAEYTFEGHKLYGIKDYDPFLKYIYGEYMVLPSEQKRKVHPASKIVLLEK